MQDKKFIGVSLIFSPKILIFKVEVILLVFFSLSFLKQGMTMSDT